MRPLALAERVPDLIFVRNPERLAAGQAIVAAATDPQQLQLLIRIFGFARWQRRSSRTPPDAVS
jgi:hypothetical protein